MPMPAASRPQTQAPAEASMKGIMISSVPAASSTIPTGSRSTRSRPAPLPPSCLCQAESGR